MAYARAMTPTTTYLFARSMHQLTTETPFSHLQAAKKAAEKAEAAQKKADEKAAAAPALNWSGNTKGSVQRRRVRWTVVEEDALRRGFSKYQNHPNKWAAILEDPTLKVGRVG